MLRNCSEITYWHPENPNIFGNPSSPPPPPASKVAGRGMALRLVRQTKEGSEGKRKG